MLLEKESHCLQFIIPIQLILVTLRSCKDWRKILAGNIIVRRILHWKPFSIRFQMCSVTNTQSVIHLQPVRGQLMWKCELIGAVCMESTQRQLFYPEICERAGFT